MTCYHLFFKRCITYVNLVVSDLHLNFGDDQIYEVIAIPVIQFIIGDCKGNDMLCGRMGGHTLQMKDLCRDCDISPNDGDDLCIGKPLKCKFHTQNSIVGKTEDELDQFSFFSINNCFTQMSFGGCERNIYGGAPAKYCMQCYWVYVTT